MRFRITHLLIAAVVVAVFVLAFASASGIWYGIIAFSGWIAFAFLGCWAAARPQSRPILVPALIASASFMWVVTFEIDNILADYWAALSSESNDAHKFYGRVGIAKFALSTFVGLLAAGLGAWLSKSDKKA